LFSQGSALDIGHATVHQKHGPSASPTSSFFASRLDFMRLAGAFSDYFGSIARLARGYGRLHEARTLIRYFEESLQLSLSYPFYIG
jgi:hypothetical protein